MYGIEALRLNKNANTIINTNLIMDSLQSAGLCAVAGTPTPDFALEREQNHIPERKEVMYKQQHSGKLCMRRDCYRSQIHRQGYNQCAPRFMSGQHTGDLNRLCQTVGTLNRTRSTYQIMLPPTAWMDEAGHYWPSSCCWVGGCCVQRSCCEYDIMVYCMLR